MKLSLLISMSDRLTSPMGNVMKTLQGVQSTASKAGAALQDMGRKMKDAGAGMTQSALGKLRDIAGVGYLFSKPISAAIKFESVMADVYKVTDPTIEQQKMLSKGILDMSKRLPVGYEGLGNIASAAGQAGIAMDELLSFTEDAGKMAIAFDISGLEAGDTMAGWRAIFKLNQKEVVSLGDTVNHLSNNMNASAPAISNFLTRAGGVGNLLGMSGEHVAAFGASLIALKTPPEVSARAFNTLGMQLTKGADATKAEKQAYKELGLSAAGMAQLMKQDATKGMTTFLDAVSKSKDPMGYLRKLLGVGFADDIAKLGGNLGILKDALNMANDKTGYAGSMLKEYEARSKTTANAIQLLKNRVAAAGIALGNIFLPTLNDALAPISAFTDGVADWVEKHPVLVSWLEKTAAGLLVLKGAGALAQLALGGLTSLVAPVLTTGGKLITYLNNASAGFKLFKETGSGVFASVFKGAWAATDLSVKLDKPITFTKNAVKATVQGIKNFLMGTRLQLPEFQVKAPVSGKLLGWLALLKNGLVSGISKFSAVAMSGLGKFSAVVIAGLGKLGTALLTLPIGWIIVGILAIVVVSRYLYQNWDKVREKAGQCWAAIKKGLVWLGDILWEAVDFLVTPFKSAFEKIKGWWEKLKGWFTGNPVTTEVNVVGNAGSVAAGAGNAPRTLRAEREMAFGGLVSRPTLSWIGEAGDEMVVPLTNRSRGQALLQEAGKRLGMPPQASQVMSIAQEAAPKMTQVMDAARKAVPKMTLPPVTSIGGGINKMKPEKEKAGKPEPGKQGKRAPMVFSGPLSINVNGASDPRAFVETMAAELQKLADSRGAAEAMGW